MKKMIALLLALIMVFSLVACSGSADTAKDTTTTDSTTTDTADTTGSDTTAVLAIVALYRLCRNAQRMTALPWYLNVIDRMIDATCIFVGQIELLAITAF